MPHDDSTEQPVGEASSTVDDRTAYQDILLAVGDQNSDPNFYAQGGAATAADYQNLVNVVFERTQPGSPERQAAITGLSNVGFFAPTDNLDFWVNATPEQVAGETAGLATAVSRLSPTTPSPFTPAPEPPPGTRRVGPPEGSSVIPDDTRLVRITDPAGSDLDELFVLIGSAFGIELAFEIGDQDRLDHLFGGVGSFANVETVNQAQFDNSGAITVGDVDEVLGSTGSIQAQLERDMRAAGQENPPTWLVEDHTAMAAWITTVNEGFSMERTWTEVSKTDAFKARFQGLDTVLDQLGTNSLVTGIAEFVGRENEIRQAILARRGPGADVSPGYVSCLFGGGWQRVEVEELLILEQRVKADPGMLDNINDILRFQQLPELSADDFITFLQEGQRQGADPNFTPGALFEGINDALRFQALIEQDIVISEEFATSLGEGVSEDIASADQFSERARIAAIEIMRNTNDIERNALGIERDDIIAAAFGEESPSGKSVSEINELLERLGRDRARRATGLGNVGSFVDVLGRLRVQGSSNL